MTDLENALRETLRMRAADITTVPDGLAAVFEDDLHPNRRTATRRRSVLLVAAAVAAVLALVAAVVAVRTTGRALPAATTPSPPAPSPSPVSRASCTVPLPVRWKEAVASGTSRYGAGSVFPLAVAADGRRTLVTRDYGQARDVAVVDRDGTARRVYSVPQPDENQVVDASIDGDHAVLDVSRLPRNSNGVIPTVHLVVLLDLRTGATKILDRAQIAVSREQRKTIDRSLIWNGHVYWDVRSRFTAATSVIKDYSVATGRTVVAGHGGSGGPQLLAQGVVWGDIGSDRIAIRRPVPAGVTVTRGLRTDGSAYAWVTETGRVGWWGPTSRAVTVAPAKDVRPEVLAVSGPFVFFTDQADSTVSSVSVLDTRTGATATAAGMQPYALAGGGTVAGYRFVGKFQDSPTAVIQLKVSGLPELRC